MKISFVSPKTGTQSVVIVRILFLVLLFGFEIKSFGQTPVLNNIVSPSPNAAALAKYAEIPVNLHTGVPSVNVPLATIQSKKLTWPIGINYHSAGIKVGEIASQVGLGWSLQASGIVTRVMRGKPDEQTNGYFEYADEIPDEEDVIALSMKEDLADGLVDMLPDFFYYNTGVSGGRIIFDNDLVPRTIPRTDAKVFAYDMANLSTFTVVEPDGTIFEFSDVETSSTYVLGPDPSPFHSTWYLTRIVSADHSDTIKFNYSSYTYTYSTNRQVQMLYYYNVPVGASKTNNYTEYVTNTSVTQISNARVLSSIEYDGGKVEFVYSNRSDDDGKKLDKIITYYKDPFQESFVEEKRINFAYSYFQSEAGENKRLRLDNVQEEVTGEYMPPYSFTYSSKGLPGINSTAMDHWGYYNGTGDDGLIPTRVYNGNYILGANREIDTDFVDGCILKTITSPLEGETELIFESNEYLDGSTDETGPGLRIRQIIKYDPFSDSHSITNYEYTRPDNGKSSGKLVQDHQYESGMAVKDLNGGNTYTYDCILNTANSTGLGSSSDSPVLYEYVTTYLGNGYDFSGKTITKFTIYEALEIGYPYIPQEDQSWAAGRMLWQEHYKVVSSSETLVAKIINEYTISPHDITITGLKAAYNKTLINVAATSGDFELRNYITYVKFQYLSESTSYSYEENSGTLASEVTTQYFIDAELDHTMPVKVTTQTSDSNVALVKEISYPADYSTGVFETMKSKNMIAMPVETKTISKQGSTENITDYTKTEYLEWIPGKIYPQYVYRPKIGSPVLRSTFNGTPGSYLQRSFTFNQYSETGFPLEVQTEGGTPSASIIDPFHSRVIAQCSNAGKDQILYTGFETPYHGGWSFNQGSSQNTANVTLTISHPQSTFEIQEGQTISYSYTVTRTAGPSPQLTFSKIGASSIQHTLNLTSGSGNVTLTAGTWNASVSYGMNVSAFSVSFSYDYVNWSSVNLSSDAKTGMQSLNLQNSHTLSRSNLPSGTYHLSYYQKGGAVTVALTGSAQLLSTDTYTAESDGWQLIRKTISISSGSDKIDLSSTGCKIDEVRLHPEQSFMVTTNHDLRGRVVTATDANLRSVFTEYDIWGRVKLVRDHQKNIVQLTEYKLAGN